MVHEEEKTIQTSYLDILGVGFWRTVGISNIAVISSSGERSKTHAIMTLACKWMEILTRTVAATTTFFVIRILCTIGAFASIHVAVKIDKNTSSSSCERGTNAPCHKSSARRQFRSIGRGCRHAEDNCRWLCEGAG